MSSKRVQDPCEKKARQGAAAGGANVHGQCRSLMQICSRMKPLLHSVRRLEERLKESKNQGRMCSWE